MYCHSEGTTTLVASRKFLGIGSEYPSLKCSHCGAVALLDVNAVIPDQWRIRYRHFSRALRYYYVALYLGKAGWLSAHKALEISTNGYVQRRRVQQARAGDLSWLPPVPLSRPLPFMDADESLYIVLKGVTYQEVAPRGLWARPDRGAVLDSGKLYVTDRALHLLGQRQTWSCDFSQILRVDYDDGSWTVYFDTGDGERLFRGLNVDDQLDAQLIATIIESLYQTT